MSDERLSVVLFFAAVAMCLVALVVATTVERLSATRCVESAETLSGPRQARCAPLARIELRQETNGTTTALCRCQR